MKSVDYNQIVQQAKDGRFAPVYFLHGEETFLTRSAVEALVAHAVDKATADFNYDRYYGADLNAETLITTLRTPPMLATRRVVLVRDLEKLSPRGKDLVADYAERPSDTSVLILAAGERIRVDRKKKSPKWAARLEEAAVSALFWPLAEHDLIRWIVAQAGLKGKTMQTRTAYELYARLGGSLERLAGEVEKLTIFCGERPEVTVEDIRGMTGIETGGTVFDWVDALATGKTLRAVSLGAHLSASGESAVGILALAAAHFIMLLRVKQRLAAREAPERIKLTLGLAHRPPEVVKGIFDQARGHTFRQLDRALSLLLDADRRLKSSSLPDKLILDDLAFGFKLEVAG
jgi:DNA polymerase III subunit delta